MAKHPLRSCSTTASSSPRCRASRRRRRSRASSRRARSVAPRPKPPSSRCSSVDAGRRRNWPRPCRPRWPSSSAGWPTGSTTSRISSRASSAGSRRVAPRRPRSGGEEVGGEEVGGEEGAGQEGAGQEGGGEEGAGQEGGGGQEVGGQEGRREGRPRRRRRTTAARRPRARPSARPRRPRAQRGRRPARPRSRRRRSRRPSGRRRRRPWAPRASARSPPPARPEWSPAGASTPSSCGEGWPAAAPSAVDLVATGRVLVNGAMADKPARLVAPGDAVVVAGHRPRFVGRGGEKLDAALDDVRRRRRRAPRPRRRRVDRRLHRLPAGSAVPPTSSPSTSATASCTRVSATTTG